jgi:dethiobiotin synthetase
VSAIFVTATGTDVGKTFVAVSLIRHLRRQGHEVEAIKPVLSGFDPMEAAASDPGILLDALGLPVTADEIERISPWRFRAPLSPDLAASMEGRRIDVADVVAFCQNAVAVRRDVLLIEGVGGIMVPLDDQRTILDVMMALGLPLILVTGSYLGSISHTLTALDSLFTRDMNVMAVIVSETPGSAVPLDEVVATIGRFTEPVIGLPRSGPRAGDPGDGHNLGQLFGAKRDR